MKKLFYFFLLIIFFSDIAIAKTISCDPYLSQPKNTIFNMGLISGNNIIKDKDVEELTADLELNENNYSIQKFFLKNHRKLKLFLLCVYQNGDSVIKKITDEFTVCIRKDLDENIPSTDPPIFYCIDNRQSNS